jgi:hypothetical protein
MSDRNPLSVGSRPPGRWTSVRVAFVCPACPVCDQQDAYTVAATSSDATVIRRCRLCAHEWVEEPSN